MSIADEMRKATNAALDEKTAAWKVRSEKIWTDALSAIAAAAADGKFSARLPRLEDDQERIFMKRALVAEGFEVGPLYTRQGTAPDILVVWKLPPLASNVGVPR